MKFTDGSEVEGKKLWGGEPILTTDNKELCQLLWEHLHTKCDMRTGICLDDKGSERPYVLVLFVKPKNKAVYFARRVVEAYVAGVQAALP